MAKLSASERARLPDSAFAHVSSSGKRSLPIHDESHVRNALSRFGQVRFQSDAERDAARRRLLQAAKRYRIVPIGFMNAELKTAKKKLTAGRLVIELGRLDTAAELEAELRRTLDDPTLTLLRWSKADGVYLDCVGTPTPTPGEEPDRSATFVQGRGRPLMAITHRIGALGSSEITEAVTAALHLVVGRELLDGDDSITGVADLPDGDVTFLLTDIEGSTALLDALGDRYADVLDHMRAIIAESVIDAGGYNVEARADEYVAVFTDAAAALDGTIAMQQAMAAADWPDGHEVRVRAGVHSGPILLTEGGYVGVTVHTAARIMSAAHGGQILTSAATIAAGGQHCQGTLRSLGAFRLRGLAHDHELVQVDADGLGSDFAPPSV